jgi:hypothetical protein
LIPGDFHPELSILQAKNGNYIAVYTFVEHISLPQAQSPPLGMLLFSSDGEGEVLKSNTYRSPSFALVNEL